MNFIEDFAETIKNIQGFQLDLFAGATETELKAAEEKMNITLPEDFKNFYRAFNGQNEYADALFDTFFLCSLKQICGSRAWHKKCMGLRIMGAFCRNG